MSPDLVAALGGLTGLGALITSTAGLIETRRRLRPNHGSSVADGVRRTEDAVRSLGHQVGELHRVMDREHADYDARLRALEARRK
ncbi:hypothetical protein [Schaalia hyovaginalis]|uniref:hypothetical protein n=1 Tax=Schaalia hyovaginalis TaxID=29316 RepID=UPI0026F32C9A|nr:hypothetical protein [Schaalia hyovaginalis]MCI6556215.1 hypothetical protein [Schaalia hyovaginalis]